jgi:hypothetical protein
MEPLPGILIVLVVMALVVIIQIQLVAARRKEVAAYAAERGLQFRSDKNRELDDRYREFGCLRRGHSRYGHNMFWGELSGLQVIGFDYHYVTGHGKNRKVHRFSAVITPSPIPLKPLFVRREHVFDKVTEFLGMDDIDFESAEFSRRYYVKAADKRWAYDVIHQRMMDFFLNSPQFNVQFDRGNIIVWRGRRFNGRDIDAAIELIRGIYERLPEYLRQQQLDTD